MDSNVRNSSGMSQPKSDGLDISALADAAKAKFGEIGAPDRRGGGHYRRARQHLRRRIRVIVVCNILHYTMFRNS